MHQKPHIQKDDMQQNNFDSSPLRFEMEIILQEFRDLRAEILAKTANEQQTLNYSIALIVATATVIQLEPQIKAITGSDAGVRVLILVISLLFSALGLMYLEQDMYMATTGKYINQVLRPKLKEIIYKATGVEKDVLEWEEFRAESAFRYPKVIAFTFMTSARYALPIFPALISISYYFAHRPNNVISIGENLLFGFAVFVVAATIIIAVIDGMTFLSIDKEKKTDALSNPSTYHVLKRFLHEGYIVPVLTIMLGIFPMAILSLQSGTLWFSPYVDFPLFSIPTIFIGDTILLPWFNFKLYRLLIQTRSFTFNSSFFIKMIISIGISYFINSYTHLMWVSDQYLGFMDTELGKLSIAGIWHLWFSVMQFTVIMLMIWISIDFYNKKDLHTLNSAIKTWQVIVLFTALTIPDFFVRHIFIFKDFNEPQLLIKDFPSFSTLFISTLVFFVLRYAFNKSAAKHLSQT